MTEPSPRAIRAETATTVVFLPKNIWRTGWVVIALVALVLFLRFVLADGGSVIFTVIMAWFLSLAMEPAVARLSRWMKRGVATVIVMIALALFVTIFLFSFGQLFFTQVAELVREIPGLIDTTIATINDRLGTNYAASDVLASLNLTPAKTSGYASAVLGGVFTLFGSVASGAFSVFTTLFLVFYLSAEGPRLRNWVAQLFPPTGQRALVEIWDLTLSKTGGYVAARVVLATINAATSAVVFVAVGLPSWLALAVWTGLVAQFVPTVGTYISIVLPVLVGLLSPRPWIGLIVLAWAVLYQQVENLTIEPRISARAVNLHPAVGFTSVLLGTSLFGIAGALLAVPVTAMLMALVEEHGRRHELLPELLPSEQKARPDPEPPEPTSTSEE